MSNLAILALVLGPAGAHPSPIVMIVADDVGSADLPFSAEQPSKTALPALACERISALASASTVTKNYYTQAMCSQSRAALMTGRYPIRYGLQDHVIETDQDYGLFLNETMLPQILKQAGFKTHAVGKWHLGFAAPEYTPTFRGFDDFFGYYGDAEDYFTHANNPDATKKDIPNPGIGYDLRRDSTPFCGSGCSQSVAHAYHGKYSSEVFGDEAVRIIQDHDASSPLFLYVAFQACHSPAEVPQSYMDLFNDTIADVDRRRFAGMFKALDVQVGRIIDKLKDRGMYDDALVVFTTDNGGPITDSNCYLGKCHANFDRVDAIGALNFPLRGGKHSLWQGGSFGGPAFAKLPGQSQGSQHFGLMHITDWFPTVLQLAMIPFAAKTNFELDGIDMLYSLQSGVPSSRTSLLLNIETMRKSYAHVVEHIGFSGAIVADGWKLVLGQAGPPDSYMLPPGFLGTTDERPDCHGGCLVDLTTDPYERNLLPSSSRPAVFEALLSRLRGLNKSMVGALYASRGGKDPRADKCVNQSNTWGPWRRLDTLTDGVPSWQPILSQIPYV